MKRFEKIRIYFNGKSTHIICIQCDILNISEFQNSKLKTLYPRRIPSSKPFTPEEFQNSKLKTLYP
jgi:hypothetical protein